MKNAGENPWQWNVYNIAIKMKMKMKMKILPQFVAHCHKSPHSSATRKNP